MRKVLFILAMLVAANGWCQRVDSIEYRSPYRDLRPVQCRQVVETNAHGRCHGKFVITGSDQLHSGQRSDKQLYTEQRNYVDGMLQGRFQQHYQHQGTGQIGGRYTISHNWKVDGSFGNELPDGTWTFEVNTKYTSSSEKENTRLKEVVVFEKGKVRSITDQQGNHLTVDAQGRISGTGTLKGGARVILTNSIITNTYVDLTGDLHPMTNEQTFMLRRVLDGEWSIFDLADHGYSLDWNEMYLSQWSRFSEHAERYARLGSLSKAYNPTPYFVLLAQLREIQLVDDAKAVEYYMQSNPMQFDEMMSLGYYRGPYGRKYLSSKAAEQVMARWEHDQRLLLGRRLSAMAKDQADASWDEYLADCREGYSHAVEMFGSSEGDVPLSLIESRFRPLFPIVGHRVDSLVFHPHKGYTAYCVIDRMSADSVGYESYRVSMPLSLTGALSLSEMDPATYQRVPNAWDTVYAVEQMVSRKHSEVLSKMGQLKRLRVPYAHHYDSIVADRTTNPEVRMADMREMDTLQQNLMAEVPMILQAEKLEQQIKQKVMGFKRVARAFRNHCEENRPEWDDTKESVEQYLEFQKKLLKAVSEEDLNLIERKSRRTNPLFLLVPNNE